MMKHDCIIQIVISFKFISLIFKYEIKPISVVFSYWKRWNLIYTIKNLNKLKLSMPNLFMRYKIFLIEELILNINCRPVNFDMKIIFLCKFHNLKFNSLILNKQILFYYKCLMNISK